MKYVLVILALLLIGSELLAQNGSRRLPPSLEREMKLRKGSSTRVMTFSDTLKAKTRIAESIRNTSLQELDSTMVQDSAIIMIDSAVSLSHKEWLDDRIAELPEYRLTAAGPRFVYPLSILIDTRRRTIPFDSTLPQRMETVERERLTANEALPLTRPIAQEKPNWLLFNAGAGTVSLPSISAIAYPVKYLKAEVALQNNIDDAHAVRNLLLLGMSYDHFFSVPHQRPDVLIPQLHLDLSHSQTNRTIRTPFDSGGHSLTTTHLGASYLVGELAELRLATGGAIRILSDEVMGTLGETTTDLSLDLAHEERPYLYGFNVNFRAADEIDVSPRSSASLAMLGATFGLVTEDKFKIGGGLAYAFTNDAVRSGGGFAPHAFLRWQQNPFLVLSASAARTYRLSTLADLTRTNLFYSPVLADSIFGTGDPRRVILEPLRIAANIEYTVSLVERLGVEVRYIMSEDEPVFELFTDSATGSTAFAATPKDTRRFEAEARATFLLFKGDELNASVIFASSTITNEERSMPFAPTMNASISYRMKALAPTFTPVVEFIHLARPDKSISLLNGEASFGLSENISLFGRIENIFNAAGDFWTSYNEHPRSIIAGIRGRF